MKPEDVTMDFFSKLENGRNAEFKTTFLNGLHMKSIQPPKDLNEIFALAKTYLKPKVVVGPGGIGSTFATTADTIEKRPGEGKGKRQRGMNLQGQGKEETPFSGDSSAKMEGFTHKKPKCFSCGGEHYINNCLEVLEFQKMKEKEKQAAAT